METVGRTHRGAREEYSRTSHSRLQAIFCLLPKQLPSRINCVVTQDKVFLSHSQRPFWVPYFVNAVFPLCIGDLGVLDEGLPEDFIATLKRRAGYLPLRIA